MKITNTFVGGKMNVDVDQRLLPKGQYFKGLNIEVLNPDNSSDTSNYGDAGILRNCLGNLQPVSTAGVALTVTNTAGGALASARCIGVCKDDASNSIFWLITSTAEDIVVQYTDNPNIIPSGGSGLGSCGAISYVLRAPKPQVDTRYLGFSTNYPVNGINFLDGYLMWTDNNQHPRMVHVATMTARTKQAGGTLPTNYIWDEDDITVIVKPPLVAPTITMSNNGTDSNYIKDRFLYFSCRFKYLNGSWSAMSPFSRVAFTPNPFVFSNGVSDAMLNINNVVNITVPTGIALVTDIQILFKDSEFPNIYIIETINKANPVIGQPITNNSTWTYPAFDNSKTYATLPSSELTRLFDNVPLKALTQDIVGSRLMYGQYTQFYDLLTTSGSKLVPNFVVGSASFPFSNGNTYEPSFKTNMDYQIAFIYLDDYGRMTTPLTCPTNSVHISAANSGKRNEIGIVIKHFPPAFATKYRLAIKQNRELYYNVFPLLVYNGDDSFTYFQLNSSDVNKVLANDTFLIKCDYDGITNATEEYQVLEVVDKQTDAITTGSPAGLYIKTNKFIQNVIAPSSYLANYVNIAGNLSIGGANTSFSTSWIAFNGNGTNPASSPVIYYPAIGASQKMNPLTSIAYFFTAYSSRDLRYIIEYAGMNGSNQHTFNYRLFDNSFYINGITPVPFRTSANVPIAAAIYDANGTTLIGNLYFYSNAPANTGDTWRLNLYSQVSNTVITGKTVAGVKINPIAVVATGQNAIYNSPQITAGTKIGIGKISDSYGTSLSTLSSAYGGVTPPQVFVSNDTYTDIQEWFWESGEYLNFIQNDYLGNPIGYNNVFFRYGFCNLYSMFPQTNRVTLQPASVGATNTEYISMMIGSSKLPNIIAQSNQMWQIELSQFYISYTSALFCLEVYPKQQVKTPVFHECTEDLAIITSGNKKFHGGNYTNQTSLLWGIVALNYSGTLTTSPNESFNCWSYDNGIESNRVREAYNQPTLEWSPRVSVPIDDYGQQTVLGLTYSGVYKFDTNVNNLNVFNLSLGNYKYLDKSFGKVQKIKARDTDIVIFQQDKISKVLYGKNLLSDSTGGGQVSSIPEVLGTQIAYEGEYGISNDPMSFAQYGDDMWCSDVQRGAVIRLNNQGLFDVTKFGMKSFFNTAFKISPNTLKIGSIDPYYKRYIFSDTLLTITGANGGNSSQVVNNTNMIMPNAYATTITEPIILTT